MKRKLLFAMAMLLAIAGVQKAKAYSTTDLTMLGGRLSQEPSRMSIPTTICS